MKCLCCGEEFKIRFRRTEKFCSNACKNKYHNMKYHKKQRMNLKCVVCGEKLTGRNYKYCSSACRLKAQHDKQEKEYKKPQAETVKPEKKKIKYTYAQIEALARAEGLTYGKYCAKYGL